MKIKFNRLETDTGNIKYSFNKGQTNYVMPNDEALANGIPIDLTECTNLSDIRLSSKYMSVVPTISEEIQNIFNLTQGVELTNLGESLSKIKNTPDTPVMVKVRPAGNLWTHAELEQLNNIINKAGVYVDLSPTDLNHEVEQHLIDVCYDTEIANWENDSDWADFDGNYEGKTISGATTFTELYISNSEEDGTDLDSNSPNVLKPFPSVFTGNTYLVGLTFPSEDNFSVTPAMNYMYYDAGESGEHFNPPFSGCINLKHVHFDSKKLYKIGVFGPPNEFGQSPDDYYIWEGQEGFKRKTDDWITILESESDFIDKLVNENGTIMTYYYWVDYKGNPVTYWKDGYGPADAAHVPTDTDFTYVGIKGFPTEKVLSVPSGVEVDEIDLSTSDNEVTPIKVVDLSNTNADCEDGILYLNGKEE